MDESTFKIIEMAVTLIMAIMSVWIIPKLKELIIQNVSSKNLADAYKWAKITVLAIQQTMGEEPGETKKAEAMEFLQAVLNESGIDMTEWQIDQLIEAAVKGMKMGTP